MVIFDVFNGKMAKFTIFNLIDHYTVMIMVYDQRGRSVFNIAGV